MKARKGDLILVESTRHDYVIGQPTVTRKDYQFAVVASATRDGIVKTFRSIGWGNELLSESAQPVDRPWITRTYVLPADIDTEGVLAAAKAHHYPNHPGQPMPFDSLDEARELARPFLRLTVSA